MKKVGKWVLIFVIIVGVLYGAFMLFINPSGYTNREDLARDFFTDIHSAQACSKYFSVETADYCETFTDLFIGETLTVDSVSSTVNKVTVTISINGNSDSFDVTFVELDVHGVKGFFHNVYYRIDVIQ